MRYSAFLAVTLLVNMLAQIPRWVMSLLVLSLILSACAPTATTSLPVEATKQPSTVPQITVSPTQTQSPPATTTVYPPVFDPETIGDVFELDSFIYESTVVQPFEGFPNTYSRTIGYIREPFSYYNIDSCEVSPEYNCGSGESYWIDGIRYDNFVSGKYIYFSESLISAQISLAYWECVHSYPRVFSRLLSGADFVGQEDYEGVPVNHFTFDETDLISRETSSSCFRISSIEEAEGVIYLSEEGNYPLYLHVRMIGPNGEFEEITDQMNSINQLPEMTLPDNYPEFSLDPGFPLPEGSYLVAIQLESEYEGQLGLGSDIYEVFLPVSEDEFVSFYEALLPTNGWSVTAVRTGNEYPYDNGVLLARGNERAFIHLSTYGAECVLVPSGACRIVEYRR